MEDKSWFKQTSDEALFPELLWARPQNKRQAGKLLIIGGSLQNFSLVAESYDQATKAGAGSVRIILPNSLQKVVGRFLPEAIFAPSNPSGSFSSSSLAELVTEAQWADAVLIAGNLGNNSETAVAIESFINKYQGIAVIVGDGIDILMPSSESLLARSTNTLILTPSQLQHLAIATSYPTAIISTLDLLQIVKILEDYSKLIAATLVTTYAGNIIVACNGWVSTTKLGDATLSNSKIAAYSAVWFLQNKTKHFEAITTAIFSTLEKS